MVAIKIVVFVLAWWTNTQLLYDIHQKERVQPWEFGWAALWLMLAIMMSGGF